MDPRSAFLDWLRECGAYVHPSLYFAHDSVSGWGLYTKEALPEPTQALRIPRALVLHPRVCHDILCESLSKDDTYECLAPRDWVLLYLVMQRLLATSCFIPKLGMHVPYVRLFPDDVLTPLHFSESELELLEGTTLYHGALQRREMTLISAQRTKTWLDALPPTANVNALRTSIGSLDWNLTWIWAENAYASRSFPPQVAGWPADDEPVLIPGFDALNHRRGEPVTWSYNEPGESVFLFRRSYAKGEQVFNNYGAKTNEELCGSYGFVEPDGLDDVLVLALRRSENEAPRVFYWPRTEPEPPTILLQALGKHEKAFGLNRADQLLSEVQAIESLEKMLRQRRNTFRRVQYEVDDAIPCTNGLVQVRSDVLDMIRTYRAAQADMLDKGLAWVETKLDQVLDELEKEG